MSKEEEKLTTEEALRKLIKDPMPLSEEEHTMADRMVDLIIDLIAERSEEKAEEVVDKHERDYDHDRIR